MRWGWVATAAICACGGSSGGAGTAVNDAGSITDAGAVDAGPDGGTIGADDCTGIVPAVPSSASAFDVGATAGQSCTAATTDRTGVIAAESHSGTASGDAAQVEWHEFDARGAPAGSFGGGMSLAPQAAGFLGLQQDTAGSLTLDWWNGSGALSNLSPVGDGSAGIALAPGFPDGAIVARKAGGDVLVQSFGAQANPINSVPVATSATVLAAAQDQSGPVLIVLSTGQGVWVDLSAGTSAAPFSLGSGSSAIARGLIGGGVAVRLGGHWAAVVSPANSILLPAPAWLTDGSDFVIARAGRAYAVTTPASNVIALAVGQTTCGAITLKNASSVSVGTEGTVIGSMGTAGCSKIFWSKLLQ
jgi:hypothetical protein